MQLSPEQKALYARCSNFFFDLREELEAALKAGGRTAAAVAAAGGGGGDGGKGVGKGSSAMKVYWSLQQRCFRDILNRYGDLGFDFMCVHDAWIRVLTQPPETTASSARARAASSTWCSTRSRTGTAPFPSRPKP